MTADSTQPNQKYTYIARSCTGHQFLKCGWYKKEIHIRCPGNQEKLTYHASMAR